MTFHGVELSQLLAAMLATGLVAAVPLTLAAVGEGFVEQAGLLNLGIEGMMLLGAFSAFWTAEATGGYGWGLAMGLVVGVLTGGIFGVLAIGAGADQVLTGLALTLTGGGATAYLYRILYPDQQPRLNETASALRVPGMSDVAVVGEALFSQTWLVYASWLMVPVAAWILQKTRFGLNVRAVGEYPFAADASGVDVVTTRYVAIGIGGGLAGLAGAFLSVVDLGFFRPGMTVGIGFIAIAIAMLGRWNPWRIFLGAVAFGLLQSLDRGLQILRIDVRTEFIQMLPYVGIIVALALLARRVSLPAALGVPYRRSGQ
ncbi:MAG: ABC transporter permease [Chloroflexota bacterium]|nr:ABC transporter permease [Chloroflexota bacterium]